MRHKIFWRDANTIQIYKLSVGSKPNDLDRGYLRVELEKKFGKQTYKPRPWGMVVAAGESESTALVFSRTSDVTNKVESYIPHKAHGTKCKINVDGSVDSSKYMKVWSAIWLALTDKLPGLESEVPIACRHSSSTCDHNDEELARKLLFSDQLATDIDVRASR